MKKQNVALIGLGPHAKRIYLNYFQKHNLNLSLLIELDSLKEKSRIYLNEHNFFNTIVFSIEDKYKDYDILPSFIEKTLEKVFKELNITHIIISTEPKAHNMYLNFALKHNIHVLSDKPITVTKDMLKLSSIRKINKQYYNLLKLSEKASSNCIIMCQRQYHKGYEYVKNILNDTVKKYNIPLTYIEIYHCDGNWEMPHDLNKENHPYKYGYGKLFHSGYHFVDLLSDFIKINEQLDKNKRITKGEIYANSFHPNDELAVCSINDYKKLFKKQVIPEYYNGINYPQFNGYGEKNFYGLIKLKNKNNDTITTVNLNLLHYGFSRRGWINSKDYYKENGRVRHEHINIQIGPLMNIQINSYQSKEIKDRLDNLTEELPGGLEHFDIEIYRNVDLIGGKPYEKIKLSDLYSVKEKENFLGYNELAREQLLEQFFANNNQKSSLKNQILGIEILTSCAKQLHNNYKSITKPTKINFSKQFKYIDISFLKSFSCINNQNDDKSLLYNFCLIKDQYEFGIIFNKLNKTNNYEVYVFISNNNDVASGLAYRQIKNYYYALIYFEYLKYVIEKVNLNNILKFLIS